MSARINNIPSYVVQDWTYLSTLSKETSVTGGGDHPLQETITGTLENMRDKDLATSYKIDVTGGSGSGSNTYHAKAIFDCGKVLWNCLIYTKYALGNGTYTIDVSDDGSSWTTIESATQAQTATYGVMSMRYIRFYAYRTDAATSVEVFECRIMGA